MPKALPITVPCGSGKPTEPGVYACRIPAESSMAYGSFQLIVDAFFSWDGKWWYPSSDAQYRGIVLSWVGPLPRTK